MTDIIAIAWGVALAVASPLQAPVNDREQPPRGKDQASQRTAEHQREDNAGGRPTAEELLEALQRERPVNEVIPPASAATGDWPRPERALWPEGWSMVNRTGYLVRDGRWWTFAFDPDDGTGPIKVLPNATLEVMVRIVSAAESPVTFMLSGEMTVFQGANYLLARVAMRAARSKAKVEETLDVKEAGDAVAPNASAEDVLAVLQAHNPAYTVMPASGPSSGDRPVRGASVSRALTTDGSPLVGRSGRVIRQGEWWAFVSESDHPDHPETPLRLLPSNNTELMAQGPEHENVSPVFIVSGEVTLFDGQNYLLPRVARQSIDSGNLRK